jgi:dTDP-4-dehydrorhamnose reductase
MRVLILGAGGQLGTDLQRAMAEWDASLRRHQDLDICDFDSVRAALHQVKPQAVLNAAAYVRVDDAESHVEEAFRVNAFAARNLALACREIDCTLVHVSTDYVFDGTKGSPYSEDDCPTPLNVYGASKLAGEFFVRHLCPRHILIRSSGLYGSAGASSKGGNFVDVMLRLAGQGMPIRVVDDQVVSPTYSRDLADGIRGLLENGSSGLYHMANTGECSWYEFAKRIFQLADIPVELVPISSEDYGAAARRPAYTVLNSAKAAGVLRRSPRPWEEALVEYLHARASANRTRVA